MIWIVLPIIVGVLCLILVLQYINTLGLKSSKKRCPDCGGRNIKVRALRKADKYYWSGRALYRFKKEGVCQDCGAVFGMISKNEVNEKWRLAGIRLQIGIIITVLVVIISIVVPRFILTDSSSKSTKATTDSAEDGNTAIDPKDYTVEFTIPSSMSSSFTQDDMDSWETDKLYQYTVNADGSITLHMTDEQYSDWVAQYVTAYKDFLNNLVGTTIYPNIAGITVDDAFTEYTITLAGDSVSNDDARLGDSLCYLSGIFDAYTGAEMGAVKVNFASQDGTLLKSVDYTATIDFDMDTVNDLMGKVAEIQSDTQSDTQQTEE